MATSITDLKALEQRANASVKKRSGGELSSEDKANILRALTLVADGNKSVQGAAEECGVNQYTLYAFVKGKKKLDLLAD